MIINKFKNYFITKQSNKKQSSDEKVISDLIHFLWKEIEFPISDSSLKSKIKTFEKSSITRKIESLPEIYLLLEQQITERNSVTKLSQQQLRDTIQEKYPALLNFAHFKLIFQSLKEQELMLCKLFLSRVLDKSIELIGSDVSQEILNIKNSLQRNYDINRLDLINERKKLLDYSTTIYAVFKNQIGINAITNIYLLIYKQHFQSYNLLESFTATLNVIPEEILAKDLIHFPSKQQMLRMLQKQLYSMEEINERLTKEIVERKKIEEELKFSEYLKTTVLETAMDGTILAKSDGTVLNWNNQAENILKVKRSETIGESIYSFVPRKLREELRTSFEDYIAYGEGQLINRRVETAVNLRDGSIVYVELTIVPIKVKDDFLFNAFFRDITNKKLIDNEIREAKVMAEKSAKAKSIFLSNMSHEIRTPLNVILGLTGILQKSGFNNPEVDRKNLDGIQFSAENLLVLINDILDFSKIEAGKITLHQADFNIHELLKNVSRGFRIKAEEKGLSYELSISDNIPKFIVGDQLRLNQILTNLLGNAIKFTQKGSVAINASVALDDKEELKLRFTVKDTGIGIPEDKLTQIFKSFYQVHKPGKTKIEGTGLGLSISKKLIELQGGTLEVSSTLGGGSQFEFTIAYQKSNLKNGYSAKDELILEKTENKVTGMKVLVAEDNKMNQFFISQLFNEWEIETEIANNGQEVLEKLEESTFDLILMDMHMPVMDGVEATIQIRKSSDPNISQIPIVACSADVFPEAKRKAIEVGMNYYITKPISEKALEEILFSLKDTPREEIEALDRPINTTKTEAASNILDLSFLNETFSGDSDIIHQVLQLFVDETPDDFIELQVSIRVQNWEQISHYAHKSKSSFSSLGLKSQAAQLQEIETLAKEQKDIERITALSDSLNKTLEYIKGEIEYHLN
ncbi:PAS domain-containing hybrid sensor histidine kinase/response regulator [Aquimarina brevivitae]|uniref:histidine kinase n=1 Tax=Aquimarina brevivitae TaxID=323412 RepID=A0A4Q7PJC3_9FLAO|nr:ATP-binding protein [Aquimarina brevivitae]RZT00378.1 PAS domain S-box-containing protein [Aquimarina brevivitae]